MTDLTQDEVLLKLMSFVPSEETKAAWRKAFEDREREFKKEAQSQRTDDEFLNRRYDI